MKVARCRGPHGELATGLVVAGGVVDASGRTPRLADFAWAVSAEGRAELGRCAELSPDWPLSDVELLSPIAERARVFCVGLNFLDHATEIGRTVDPHPRVFLKTHETLVPPGGVLRRPVASEQFDYEGEVAVTIGMPGAGIEPGQALRHVAAYSCFQDGSVRDYQRHTTTAGKNFDDSSSIGPWLVTADEIAVPERLELTTHLNGEVVQQAKLAEMVYSIGAVLSYVSAISTLRTGDVVSMGTPAGVGFHGDPPRWLREGDLLEVEVPEIGSLTMTVADADRPPCSSSS